MSIQTHTPSNAAEYHRRTKHHLARFAAGPDTLDWDAQPSPFRTWTGAPMVRLPLVADRLSTSWAQMGSGRLAQAHALNLQSLACLLELSMALTAWKQFGPDRWALRANPSSGNLHPTEAYVLAFGVEGLEDGLYHYEPLQHALACRAKWASQPVNQPRPQGLWIGLSSIQWREAWKYGERAFRYCQLDAGHALGALRYGAAALGWQACKIPDLNHAILAACMGLDRAEDFGLAELEEPEMLLSIGPQAFGTWPDIDWQGACWFGQASRLDPRPMYKWPVIDDVAQATRLTQVPPPATSAVSVLARSSHACLGQAALRRDEAAASVIKGRRSAQHFDRKAAMSQAAFEALVQSLAPVHTAPFDAWPHAPRVHPIFYVHRVEGVPPGVYVLPRSRDGEVLLRQEIKAAGAWQAAWVAQQDERDQPWTMWQVAEHPTLAGVLRQLSCHQAIAHDACFAMSLVAEFEGPLASRDDAYRLLLQEAGLIGQAIYLNAEAWGYRGTGIGCYFDDAVHHLLSMEGERLQVLYHFTVGVPLQDERISTEPPYAHLDPSRMEITS